MTQEEVTRITNACDIVCANCERKHDYAFVCDDCVVSEVSSNAVQQCIEDGCPDEPSSEFDDDEDTVYPDPAEDVWDGDGYECDTVL